MKDWWIRFGCFLTGYNYRIVRNSSEVAAKTVKRYTAALLIVCILWAFIGYTFTERYLHGGIIGSAIGGIIFIVVIIQIERQIILSINPSKWLYVSRGVIAGMMAILGAIIIDQIIFKEDIELEKISSIQKKVNEALPPKTEEYRNQIKNLDSTIEKKETERIALIGDIEANPTIKSVSTQTTPTIVKSTKQDSLGRIQTSERVQQSMSVSVTNVANPKQALIVPLETNIAELRKQKNTKEDALLNVRASLENEIKSKTGFLDELEVMFALISRSKVALAVWLIWFFFLFGLEMLVLMSKMNEKESDYEKTVKHHMELQMRQLDAFSKAAMQ